MRGISKRKSNAFIVAWVYSRPQRMGCFRLLSCKGSTLVGNWQSIAICYSFQQLMSYPIKVAIVLGIHLFPFRTEKLSPIAPMVLRNSGRVGSRHLYWRGTEQRWNASFRASFLLLSFFIVAYIYLASFLLLSFLLLSFFTVAYIYLASFLLPFLFLVAVIYLSLLSYLLRLS